MSDFIPKEKIIAFVDILGFTKHIRAAEAGIGFRFDELVAAAKYMGSIHSKEEFEKYGYPVCPQSKCLTKNLDYEVTQVSDCMIISAERSVSGCLVLLKHCWSACIYLLTKGLLCRGFVKIGTIYHSGFDCFGSGYIDVSEKEKGVSFFKRDVEGGGTPFIELDPAIKEFIESSGDNCARTMFGRFSRTEGGLTALYPFQMLSSPIGNSGSLDNDRVSNRNLRNSLMKVRDQILAYSAHSDDRAKQKVNYYIRALDEQITLCDRNDQAINRLQQPFGHRMTKDRFPGLFR